MWTYVAPIRSMIFNIETMVAAVPDWQASGGVYADLDIELVQELLSQAGRFASEVLAPINAAADLQGCQLQGATVNVPSSFKQAYDVFCQGGWPALSADPKWGGQGLPQLLNVALYEMLAASNHAWLMYPGLSHGAYECLHRFANPELQARYLPDLVSGHTLATMCLTEPQAGSDLSLIRTKAVSQPNTDKVLVSGQKVFISGGDHDLTDNILHLVLCRLDNAPVGSKGLSLVLVPKYLPDGALNQVQCIGLEKKMGVKASATCVMEFAQAQGWLIGSAHQGLSAMFVMMNAARVQVGMQGLGHLEMATQNAWRYAQTRQQSRAPAGSDTSASFIVQHPAMRRILWTNQAWLEGQRYLAYWTAHLIDMEHVAAKPNPWIGILTPIVKSLLTDQGFKGAVSAQQVWGGYGYLHDYGIEQCVRDARIALIYEGTNEIQAIDLLIRKVLPDNGFVLNELLNHIASELMLFKSQKMIDNHSYLMVSVISHLRDLVLQIKNLENSDSVYSLADDFLQLLGTTLVGWAWIKAAYFATIHINAYNDSWYSDRVKVACFGLEAILPNAMHLVSQLQKNILKESVLPSTLLI